MEHTFNWEGPHYLVFNEKGAFFTFEKPKKYGLWLLQKVWNALHYILVI